MKKFFGLLIGINFSIQIFAGTFTLIEVNTRKGNGGFDGILGDSAKVIYGAGELNQRAVLNDLLYFVATDVANNDELWVTDGTPANTHKIKELNPFGGANIGDLRVVNGKLLFLANETIRPDSATDDFDLFVSDGTALGTYKIFEANNVSNTQLAPTQAGLLGADRLVFCTTDKVMITNAQTAGTLVLATIPAYSQGTGYCDLNGKVYFTINENEIWKTDGSVVGTNKVYASHFFTGFWGNNSISEMKSWNNKIYFSATSGSQGGYDLFSFDGADTNSIVKVFSRNTGNTYPRNLEIYENSLWFKAYDSTLMHIYRIQNNSNLVEKVWSFISSDQALNFGNGNIYFQTDDNQGFHQLNATNLTHTFFHTYGYLLNFNSTEKTLLAMGNKVFFTAQDSVTSMQVLLESDGTTAGTHVLMPAGVSIQYPFNYFAGCGIRYIFDFSIYKNKIVIPANFNDAGRELWFYEEAGLVNKLSDLPSTQEILTYPNPAREEIVFEVNKSENMSFEILDLEGQLVKKGVFESPKTTCDLKDLSAGNYVAVFKSKEQIIGTKKLLISK